jgi:hypothetical protein
LGVADDAMACCQNLTAFDEKCGPDLTVWCTSASLEERNDRTLEMVTNEWEAVNEAF